MRHRQINHHLSLNILLLDFILFLVVHEKFKSPRTTKKIVVTFKKFQDSLLVRDNKVLEEAMPVSKMSRS